MKVINIHKRIVNGNAGELLKDLASDNDKIWPCERWPAMRFRDGLKVKSKGGHGPIRYTITDYKPSEFIEFTFRKPTGFHGTHSFKFLPIEGKTEVIHKIDMSTSGSGTLLWIVAIRWLHDALLEDSLDKIQKQYEKGVIETQLSAYVRFLRWLLKKRK